MQHHQKPTQLGKDIETMLFRFVLTCAAALTVVNAFAPASFARLNVRTSCRQMSMADLTERNDLRNVAIIGNYLHQYYSAME